MQRKKRRIALVSSFLPRKCGIATFCSDLVRSISRCAPAEFEPLVIAMQADTEFRYNEPVKFEIRRNVRTDYLSAAEYINCSQVETVLVQHEFGLFGGSAGSFLNLLLKKVNPPVIVTLHTVLNDPQPPYRKSMTETAELASRLIVMNRRGIDMLRHGYDVPREKIKFVPHGIPEMPLEESHRYKAKLGLGDNRVILTFGLVSRNKGIEVMLRAMPDIIADHPDTLYVVLGATHPEITKIEGEAYRFSLHRLARELKVQDRVLFLNRFVSDRELYDYMAAADIYVTPYLNQEQLTSGTLARAVGGGKAVISTPYWAAEELLANGRGRLVPFGDSQALASETNEILSDDNIFNEMRRRAYEYGLSMTWPRVGAAYWRLLSSKLEPVRVSSGEMRADESTVSAELPSPSLAHIQRLTDDTGILQHARYILPDRDHGYCTDDNARGVVVMSKYYNLYAGREALRLLNLYLAFTYHAQDNEGAVRNLMTFERTWFGSEQAHDALGRSLWAFGAIMANAPSPQYIHIYKEAFDRSFKRLGTQSLRGNAYAVLGMADYLQQFPGASEMKRELASVAGRLVDAYKKNSSRQWEWFEEWLSYDNAVFPQALFTAGRVLGESAYIDAARITCDFLLGIIYNGSQFSFIGNKGWLCRGGNKPAFDQQPIDAASTVTMLRAAYDATGQKQYLALMRRAFDWFLGANDLGLPIYDFKTEGCCDGFSEQGVSFNQGAESTLSFMLSLLSVIEIFTQVSSVPAARSEKSAPTDNNVVRAEISPAPARPVEAEVTADPQ